MSGPEPTRAISAMYGRAQPLGQPVVRVTKSVLPRPISRSWAWRRRGEEVRRLEDEVRRADERRGGEEADAYLRVEALVDERLHALGLSDGQATQWVGLLQRGINSGT